ncbi:molybdopterin-dependent oxidoreductase [Halofilum ochraceum]|uniref:molybdopterin-dependent oxidoreductase n=1 Tax=Halofilum ochraceum TaxID=1611323 RepID=UPI0008DA1E10|nr:molybdopterin-dependent oxidoreductase [Halofilum ochraceum]
MLGTGHPLAAFCLGILLGLVGTPAFAMSPSDAEPSDDTTPILTVVDDGNTRELSLRDIERLPLYEAELEHFEGLTGLFTGVRLEEFIDEFGLSDARRLRFIAADDYTIFLTPEEVRERGFLLVTRFDGEPVPPTQLGPLMLVVPDEEEAVLAGEISPTEWMWSIIEIRIQ